jgi:PAS domain S-box-containing protein
MSTRKAKQVTDRPTADEDDAGLKLRVLVLAPYGHDAAEICRVLGDAKFTTECCADVEGLCAQIRAGAAAAVIADDVLDDEGRVRLTAELADQPTWSDFPLVIVTSAGREPSDGVIAARGIAGTGHVNLIERPLHAATLIRAVRTATRSRERQYQIRADREHLQRITESLENRVVHQTREIELLAKAVSHLGEGVLITGAEAPWPLAKIIFANAAMRRITGYATRDLIGRTPDVLHGERTDRAMVQRLQAELSAGRSCSAEHTCRHKDGTSYEAELFITPLLDAGGEPTNFVAIHRDVSERKRAEEALRRNQHLLAEAERLSHTGAWECDLADDRWIFSDEMTSILGCRDNELPSSQSLPIVHPSDRTAVEQALAKTRDEGQPYAIEHRIIRQDTGEVRFLQAHGSVVRDDAGDPVKIRGVAQDITDRRRAERELRASEERFRLFMDNSPAIAWIKDEQGHYVYLNKTYEQRFNVRIEDRRDKSDSEVWPREIAEKMLQHDLEALASTQVVEVLEEIPDPDGTSRIWRVYRVPFTSPEGMRYMGGIGVDITERMRALEAVRDREAQLRQLTSQLTLVEQRERRRLAKLLHDHLQQLLVAAKLGLSNLARQGGDQLSSALEGVNALIDDAIKASRTLAVEIAPPILHEAGLGAALEWLGKWIQEKHGLEVEVRAAPEAATDREDVRVLMFESVRELLFNASKHAGVAKAQVELAAHDDQHLRVTVSDEGRGFDPDLLTNGNGETAGGFGLFHMRERLTALGGRMEIDAAVGRGARFTLIAPVLSHQAAGESEPSDRAAARDETGVGAPRQRSRWEGGPGIRLLLVDDHDVVRKGLTTLLSDEPGFEVVGEASDGAVAVEQAEALDPDVVLMDFSLPIVDGVEATRRIRTRLPHIQVIGLSMYETAAAAMIEAGAATVLAKSGPSLTLIQTIRQVHAASAATRPKAPSRP